MITKALKSKSLDSIACGIIGKLLICHSSSRKVWGIPMQGDIQQIRQKVRELREAADAMEKAANLMEGWNSTPVKTQPAPQHLLPVVPGSEVHIADASAETTSDQAPSVKLAAIIALTKQQGPMHISSLIMSIRAQGASIKDAANLSSILSKDKSTFKVTPGQRGFWQLMPPSPGSIGFALASLVGKANIL